MAQDIAFWNWPVDAAAARSNARGLAALATVLYGLGALSLLVAPSLKTAAASASQVGLVLVLLGVAISVGVIAKVLVTRSRHAFGQDAFN